jgi:hypothetical protein
MLTGKVNLASNRHDIIAALARAACCSSVPKSSTLTRRSQHNRRGEAGFIIISQSKNERVPSEVSYMHVLMLVLNRHDAVLCMWPASLATRRLNLLPNGAALVELLCRTVHRTLDPSLGVRGLGSMQCARSAACQLSDLPVTCVLLFTKLVSTLPSIDAGAGRRSEALRRAFH